MAVLHSRGRSAIFAAVSGGRAIIYLGRSEKSRKEEIYQSGKIYRHKRGVYRRVRDEEEFLIVFLFNVEPAEKATAALLHRFVGCCPIYMPIQCFFFLLSPIWFLF